MQGGGSRAMGVRVRTMCVLSAYRPLPRYNGCGYGMPSIDADILYHLFLCGERPRG